MGDEEEKSKAWKPVIPDVSNIDMSRVVRTPKASEPDFIPYDPKGRDVMAKTFQATGLMWLGGFGGGGVFGMLEGWKGAANPSMKIRMNSVMNSVSKRGSKTANALAMIAFVHTLASWGVDKLDLDTYTGDTTWTTPIISGFITGSFYKSTASPRAALLAGVIGSGVSAAYSVGGGFVYNELFRKGGRY